MVVQALARACCGVHVGDAVVKTAGLGVAVGVLLAVGVGVSIGQGRAK